MFAFIHYIITWGIGSNGPLCEAFPEDAPQDITDVNCVICLKNIIAHERRAAELLKEEANSWRDFAEEAHVRLQKVDPDWRPSS